jgi:hypothetical protein
MYFIESKDTVVKPELESKSEVAKLLAPGIALKTGAAEPVYNI